MREKCLLFSRSVFGISLRFDFVIDLYKSRGFGERFDEMYICYF